MGNWAFRLLGDHYYVEYTDSDGKVTCQLTVHASRESDMIHLVQTLEVSRAYPIKRS